MVDRHPPRPKLQQVQPAPPDDEADHPLRIGASSVTSCSRARSRIDVRAFASAQATGSSTAQASPVAVCRNQNDRRSLLAKRNLGRNSDAVAARAVWRKVRRVGKVTTSPTVQCQDLEAAPNR